MDANKRRLKRRSWPALLAAAAIPAALLAACGGGKGDDYAARPAAGQSTAPAPPAAPVSNRAATLPNPVPVSIPANRQDAILGGANEAAAKAITESMTQNGMDLTGVRVYVFPIAEAKQSLFVMDFDVDRTPQSPLASKDASNRAFAALPGLPAVKEANVTRLAMVVRGRDSTGPYVATATFPMSMLEAAATGTASQAELQKQLLLQLKR